jgi:hypothetical protein
MPERDAAVCTTLCPADRCTLALAMLPNEGLEERNVPDSADVRGVARAAQFPIATPL